MYAKVSFDIILHANFINVAQAVRWIKNQHTLEVGSGSTFVKYTNLKFKPTESTSSSVKMHVTMDVSDKLEVHTPRDILTWIPNNKDIRFDIEFLEYSDDDGNHPIRGTKGKELVRVQVLKKTIQINKQKKT